MAFALLSRSRSKTQGSVKPVLKRKSARAQHPSDSLFGFAKPVFQPHTAALPTAPVIQAKLKVGEPNDRFEQETNRVAELTENANGSISPSAAAQSRSAVGNLQPLYGNQALLQMRHGLGDPLAPAVPLRPGQDGILQRKCACGSAAAMSEECEECNKKKRLGLQTKLKVNEPGDVYEQEADRIADQVMATPAHHAVSVPPTRIQRFAVQPAGQAEAAPASVDQVLASPGRPLEPALRQDMEQRFGHDFSQIRVHADSQAAESAKAVQAHAYTVARDIVFGAGQYAPYNHAGRRLLAHELAHTLQQGAAASKPIALPQSGADQQDPARLALEAGKGNLSEKPQSAGRVLQKQPDPDADTERCPRGEISLGPGLPCIPFILPDRKCPIGQIEFAGYCVSLRQRLTLLGGTLQPPTVTLPSPPSAASSSGASTSGKSARVLRMENLRHCAYTLTYSNLREVDCDTAWRNAKGTNPPHPLCGASLVYDIVSVSASGSKCPAKLEGLKVSEHVKGDQGCTVPGVVWPTASCTIEPGGKLTACTDTFTLCGFTHDVNRDCKEIVDQELEVGGQLAEEHEIIYELTKSGKDCTGKVTRN